GKSLTAVLSRSSAALPGGNAARACAGRALPAGVQPVGGHEPDDSVQWRTVGADGGHTAAVQFADRRYSDTCAVTLQAWAATGQPPVFRQRQEFADTGPHHVPVRLGYRHVGKQRGGKLAD